MNITIGMIGGKGKMGTFFTKILTPYVSEIKVTDVDSQHLNEELIRVSNVIIITVPIHRAASVIRGVVPYLREDQLIMDLTSLKQMPCEEMLKSKASVIGMHPMFGPHVSSLKGQNVVLCPIRPGDWKQWIIKILEQEKADILETTPEKHDEMMALVQCLTHFSSLIFGDVMRLRGFNYEEASQFASPVFKMQLYVLGRILSQSSELYCDIQTENPYFPKVLEDLGKSFEMLKEIVLSKDQGAFKEFFNENERAFANIKEKSQAMTNRFIQVMGDK